LEIFFISLNIPLNHIKILLYNFKSVEYGNYLALLKEGKLATIVARFAKELRERCKYEGGSENIWDEGEKDTSR